jgi:chromosome segregation ATPase
VTSSGNVPPAPLRCGRVPGAALAAGELAGGGGMATSEEGLVRERLAAANTCAEQALARIAQVEARQAQAQVRAEEAAAEAGELRQELDFARQQVSGLESLESLLSSKEDEILTMSAAMERVLVPAQAAVREAAALKQQVDHLRRQLEQQRDSAHWKDRYDVLKIQALAERTEMKAEVEGARRAAADLKLILREHQAVAREQILATERQCASVRDSYYALAFVATAPVAPCTCRRCSRHLTRQFSSRVPPARSWFSSEAAERVRDRQ